MAKKTDGASNWYRVVETSFIGDALRSAGDYVQFDGDAGSNLEAATEKEAIAAGAVPVSAASQVASQQADLDAREKEIAAREKAADEKQKELDTAAEAADQRAKELDAREAAVAAKEAPTT